ncbi:hypothetical protein GQR58_026620 [Nymphon striatum]|nr:hypothetical protein GQR58_026620 [Nymphon striatum]
MLQMLIMVPLFVPGEVEHLLDTHYTYNHNLNGYKCMISPFYESSSEDLLLDNAQTNSSWFESIHTSLNGFNLNSSSIIHSIVWGEQSLANCNLPIQFVSNYFVSVLKCRLKLLN